MVKIHESSLNSSDMGELVSASDSKTFDAVSDTLQAEKESLPEKDLRDQDNAREEPGRQTDKGRAHPGCTGAARPPWLGQGGRARTPQR